MGYVRLAAGESAMFAAPALGPFILLGVPASAAAAMVAGLPTGLLVLAAFGALSLLVGMWLFLLRLGLQLLVDRLEP